MNQRTVNLIRNLPVVLQHMGAEELYQLAVGLGDELARRSLDAVLEARALQLALLVPARQEHHLRLADELLSASVVNVDAGGRQVSDVELDAALPDLIRTGAVKVIEPRAENF